MDRIVAEHRSTAAWHARITGSDDPLADNPTLARSIRNRYPYLDPLHVMQVELLRRHRAGRTDTSSSSGHPAHAQRHRHRPAQQRLSRGGGGGRERGGEGGWGSPVDRVTTGGGGRGGDPWRREAARGREGRLRSGASVAGAGLGGGGDVHPPVTAGSPIASRTAWIPFSGRLPATYLPPAKRSAPPARHRCRRRRRARPPSSCPATPSRGAVRRTRRSHRRPRAWPSPRRRRPMPPATSIPTGPPRIRPNRPLQSAGPEAVEPACRSVVSRTQVVRPSSCLTTNTASTDAQLVLVGQPCHRRHQLDGAQLIVEGDRRQPRWRHRGGVGGHRL